MDNEQVYTDWDKVYSTEEWKTLKWDLGQIFSDHIHITATGAIEGNPSIHRMAQYAWRYAQSHSQQGPVLPGVRWRPMCLAPKNGSEIIMAYDAKGEDCTYTQWSDMPVCMAGQPNGCCKAGWATSSSCKTDRNLPLDEGIMWREPDESASIPFPTEQEIDIKIRDIVWEFLGHRKEEYGMRETLIKELQTAVKSSDQRWGR